MAAAALAMGGCGGSSSHKTTAAGAGTTTTPPTFVAQLDSVCTRADNAFAAAHTHKGQVAVVAHYLQIFHSLPAPARLRALYARYLGVLDQELIDLKRGDSAGLFQLAHSKAKPLAKQLGATGCVTSS
jgi:hypothetical protein